MRRLALFVGMCVLGGAGAAGGALLGNSAGTGGVFVGGALGGALMVVLTANAAVRLGWIREPQRFWTIVGGLLGFASAALVTLATISTPVGPAASTVLIGMGAALGTEIGRSAHADA